MIRKACRFVLGLVLYLGYRVILFPEQVRRYLGLPEKRHP